MKILGFARFEEKWMTKMQAVRTTARMMHNCHCWISRSKFVQNEKKNIEIFIFLSCEIHFFLNLRYYLVAFQWSKVCWEWSKINFLSHSFRPQHLFNRTFNFLSCYISDIPAYMLLLRGVDINTQFEPSLQTVLPDFEGWFIVESTN